MREAVVVVAESVASFGKAGVAKLLVRLPVAVEGVGSEKRRVDGSHEEEEEEKVLIAPRALGLYVGFC